MFGASSYSGVNVLFLNCKLKEYPHILVFLRLPGSKHFCSCCCYYVIVNILGMVSLIQYQSVCDDCCCYLADLSCNLFSITLGILPELLELIQKNGYLKMAINLFLH